VSLSRSLSRLDEPPLQIARDLYASFAMIPRSRASIEDSLALISGWLGWRGLGRW
jgi:hypothetical protein